MKKLILVTCITCTLLLGALGLCRLTGMLQWYSCANSANEPTLRPGARFFTSSLKKPERFAMIVFERTNAPVPDGNGVMIYRLCGLPGDKVQLKDGVLFVNGTNADKDLNLINEYVVTRAQDIAQLSQIAMQDNPPADMHVMSLQPGIRMIISMTSGYLREHRLDFPQWLSDSPEAANLVSSVWKSPWTMDNFGPVTVPPDQFFVLGDNRHNALDSRFTGFVPRSSLKGTVLK